MGNLNVRTITGKDGQPVSFPTGISIGAGAAGLVNTVGLAGQQGFGVGICPGPMPAGMAEMYGTRDPASDNYGNYMYSDGSVMVWLPTFYYKWGTGANGLALNAVDIKAFVDYSSEATANAAGYALHRAFLDGGAMQPGVFVDKYLASNNGGIASSVKNGNPLSSAATHNPFGGLTGAPANFHYGAIDAAKTRGAAFFCNSRFIFSALAMLSYAHGQSATSTAWCAWYDGAGITNYPKGCNNNALGDSNDAAILYQSDGFLAAPKTGSANLFARTAHNGQNCGVVDLNGGMWEISLGITADVTNLYVLNNAVRMRDLTGGVTLATDAWGATGLAAQFSSLGASYESLWATAVNRAVHFGNVAAQTFSAATSGVARDVAGAGVPLAAALGGTNVMGNDALWDYKLDQMCPLAGGHWGDATAAGVWALSLANVRGNLGHHVGFRSALYL